MGKVTVKHFLNSKVKKLKAITWTSTEDGEYQALYVRVIANRKNVEFKSRVGQIEEGPFVIKDFETVGIKGNQQTYLKFIPEVIEEWDISEPSAKIRKKIVSNHLVKALQTEREVWTDVYNYFSKLDKENFNLKVIPEIGDSVFVTYQKMLNFFMVDQIKGIFWKDDRYNSFSNIISPVANILQLLDFIRLVSETNSEFEKYFSKHCGALVRSGEIVNDFLLSKEINHIPIISWVVKDYWEECKSYIKSRQILSADEMKDVFERFEIFQESIVDNIQSSYPEILLEK